jgi:hypothetical protein
MAGTMFRVMETSAFLIIVALAFVGVIFLGTIVHELSHWEDYKDFVKDDSICLIDMPAEGASGIMNIHGTYYYQYDTSVPGWEEKATTIDRYTELKAYSIEMIFIGVLFLGSMALVLWRRTMYRTDLQVASTEHKMHERTFFIPRRFMRSQRILQR